MKIEIAFKLSERDARLIASVKVERESVITTPMSDTASRRLSAMGFVKSQDVDIYPWKFTEAGLLVRKQIAKMLLKEEKRRH